MMSEKEEMENSSGMRYPENDGDARRGGATTDPREEKIRGLTSGLITRFTVSVYAPIGQYSATIAQMARE
jgi:hypothetical protein